MGSRKGFPGRWVPRVPNTNLEQTLSHTREIGREAQMTPACAMNPAVRRGLFYGVMLGLHLRGEAMTYICKKEEKEDESC